jgi:hypothetical protein
MDKLELYCNYKEDETGTVDQEKIKRILSYINNSPNSMQYFKICMKFVKFQIEKFIVNPT